MQKDLTPQLRAIWTCKNKPDMMLYDVLIMTMLHAKEHNTLSKKMLKSLRLNMVKCNNFLQFKTKMIHYKWFVHLEPYDEIEEYIEDIETILEEEDLYIGTPDLVGALKPLWTNITTPKTAKGERTGFTTQERREEVQRMRTEGAKYKEIASKFGISTRLVSYLVNGR